MAMQLSLQTRTTTLVDLQGAGYAVLDDFYPAPSADGSGEVADPPARVLVWDTAGSTVDQKIQAINNALYLARIHKQDAEAVYVHYAKNSTDTAARSKVSAG